MNQEKAHVSTDGFEGILFPVNQRKDKVVIVLSGSNGGIYLTRQCAQFYAKHNIPSLAVALFKTKETSENLDRVPVEYIESAIKWLQNKGYIKIGIDGTSKGSELALLSATMFPQLTCVIAHVPSYFVSEGLKAHGKSKCPSGTSCWSYHGKELPYAPYNTRKFNILKYIIQKKELNLLSINQDKKVTKESIIKVEKINGPILLLSSIHDSVWPSFDSAHRIESRLKEHDFKFPYKHISYNNISHMMLPNISPAMKLLFQSERHNKAECKKERIQLAMTLLDWINKTW